MQLATVCGEPGHRLVPQVSSGGTFLLGLKSLHFYAQGRVGNGGCDLLSGVVLVFFINPVLQDFSVFVFLDPTYPYKTPTANAGLDLVPTSSGSWS